MLWPKVISLLYERMSSLLCAALVSNWILCSKFPYALHLPVPTLLLVIGWEEGWKAEPILGWIPSFVPATDFPKIFPATMKNGGTYFSQWKCSQRDQESSGRICKFKEAAQRGIFNINFRYYIQVWYESKKYCLKRLWYEFPGIS